MTQATILSYRGVWPQIHETAFVAPSAVLIGDVVIGPESSVWAGCILRGDLGPLRVGRRSNLQDGTVMHATDPSQGGHGVFVGDEVTVGHMALLHDCVVEDRAFIGMRATILDGGRVESEGMLAAGALLTPGKVVGRGQIWAGNPAKFFREIKPEERVSFDSRAGEYAALAASYLVDEAYRR